MPPRKVNLEVFSGKKNQFAALADSDSENENEIEYTLEKLINIQEKTKEESKKNEHGESEDKNEQNESSKLEELQKFRTWIRNESENRFSGDEVKKNIFSSPFSKNKRDYSHKQWNHPRFREDSDGWVSIRWSQPQFEEIAEENDVLTVTYESRTQPLQFPSLLKRGATNISNHITNEEAISASMWAEKIKKNLEKAEQARASKAKEYRDGSEKIKEILGRVSFFKRNLLISKEDV